MFQYLGIWDTERLCSYQGIPNKRQIYIELGFFGCLFGLVCYPIPELVDKNSFRKQSWSSYYVVATTLGTRDQSISTNDGANRVEQDKEVWTVRYGAQDSSSWRVAEEDLMEKVVLEQKPKLRD